ncbi:LysR family transcriptional regulator [Pseudomonas sp. CCC3.1]|uniref:LysR family transcriptional regulator n=1 Tax=Pseudomonas sp. CCC3.1 TaxID=3048607 RepID=UPI002AC8D3DC|nr:LysR family transcriptional regulator [Pseudomonas sp. CCC3.1]MEB0206572.1 LysR family transcriptional regulator [Pseudomonas sp. CCC3.1]WPX38989.1 LysR family transcriptional regulator [Pseudomonas sp. CCC3.1]
MAFLEPATPQGNTPYRKPCDVPEPRTALAHTVDPEVARYFLVSARCGCFTQAARSLNIKATLLRKQLAQLEEQMRTTLFVFQGRSLVLSPQGQRLQAQLIALAHEQNLPVSASEQPRIRLAVAEPILHDILGRDLIALLRRNASVRLDIISLNSEQDVRKVEADVVVWLSDMHASGSGPGFAIQPAKPLACVKYLPHIAKRYSRLISRPDCLEDLADYMLVQWQPDDQIEALRPWNSLIEQRRAAVVHVHDYSLMLEMIRCGACIGLLPRYMSYFDRALIAIPGLLPESLQRQAWMAVNADVSHPQEVQMLADLIVSTFEGRKEWFDSPPRPEL